MNINISDEFKNTIKYFIEHSETKKVNDILRDLIEQSYVDDEFGHLIWPDPEQEQYDEEADALVIDAVETEIKNQLLVKFNE